MDLLPLLRAHAERVAHLREVLYGDGVVNEVTAADDEACQLGQWPKEAGELPHLSRLLVRALQELSQATARPRGQKRRDSDGQTDRGPSAQIRSSRRSPLN